MTSVIKKLAKEYQCFVYKDLPQRIKRKCRENIIAIITGRNTQLGIDGWREDKNGGWLSMVLIDGCTLWLEFGVGSGSLQYGESPARSDFLEKRISLEKLPKKAALLLAVIHRPLYDIYKQYLENRE